jgi:hypothetical protein
MIRSLAALTLLGSVLLPVTTLCAQRPGDSVTHSSELRTYVLTMPHLREFKQAALNIQNYARAHADEAQKWGELSDNDSGTLDDQVRRIEAVQPVRAAITSTGLTIRDYLLTSITFFQAGMAAAIEDSYAKTKQKAPAFPGNLNPANVTFMRVHKAEIERLKLGELTNSGGI